MTTCSSRTNGRFHGSGRLKACRPSGRKQGQLLSLFTLFELILSVAVVTIVILLINSIVSNANHFQQFFAKDNALLVETLHGVPNGKVSMTYPWTSDSFKVVVEPQKVAIFKITKEKGGVRADNPQEKHFGKSASVPVTPDAFLPASYQLARDGNSISISQSPSHGCPETLATLDGLSLTESHSGYQDGQAPEAMVAEIASGVALARQGSGWSASGLSTRFVFVNAPQRNVTVYVSPAAGEAGERLACLLSQAALPFVDYGAYTTALPPEIPATGAPVDDVTVVVSMPEDALRSLQQPLADAYRSSILAYWGSP